MKLNWKTLKTVIALLVIVGVGMWVVDSVRSRSYTGKNLNFGVTGGQISIANPSDQSIPMQIVSSGSRTFRVSSSASEIAGSSTRQGTGRTQTQLFEFGLPPGTTEFSVSGGTDVNVIANSNVELEATVDALSSDNRRNALILAAVTILGVLFYISNLTNHRWMQILRRRESPHQQSLSDTKPSAVVRDGGQGRPMRSYGDNRTDL